MSEKPKVQKAQIVKLDKSGSPTQETVVCHFNPKEFHVKKAISWVRQRSIGGDTPTMTFAGGDTQDMTIELLFDSTDTGSDVRDSYETLLTIAAIDTQRKNAKTKKSEPASCQFQWGKLLSFNAVIKQIDQRFTMFKPDGTPVRATVTVTFSQIGGTTKGQNPTTRIEPRRTWVVREGERLDLIAFEEYGDAAQWHHIAEVNNLANPRELKSGQILMLTPLS